jgi:hypothetical protein
VLPAGAGSGAGVRGDAGLAVPVGAGLAVWVGLGLAVLVGCGLAVRVGSGRAVRVGCAVAAGGLGALRGWAGDDAAPDTPGMAASPGCATPGSPAGWAAAGPPASDTL